MGPVKKEKMTIRVGVTLIDSTIALNKTNRNRERIKGKRLQK